jgi:VanZ like family.
MKYFVFPLIFMAAIFLCSSIPMDHQIQRFEFIMGIDPALQNILHIPAFGILTFLWIKSLIKLHISKEKAVFVAVLVTFLYGIADEFHQYFVPGRFFSLQDMVFNLTGTLLTGSFYTVIYQKKAK